MRTARHPLLVLAVGLLVLAAATGLWRSAAPRHDDAGSIAAQLLCPACQGESVAQSQSPMAAAMRDTIAAQLAAGRTPDQVRQWFVDTYGPQILADPPPGGLGVLLWLLPAAAVGTVILLLVRARSRERSAATVPPPAGCAGDGGGDALEPSETLEPASDALESASDALEPASDATPASGGRRAGPERRARRTWDAVAVGVVALVGAVAVAAPHAGSGAGTAPASGSTSGDGSTAVAAPASAATLLDLARSLEDQGRYAEAAQVYREVVQQEPGDDPTRLRLALTLLRAGQPAEAATNARHVLDHAPRDTQALLLLGLAQRASGSPEAPATLRRFLAAAPHDPAAAQVRRLLGVR